MDGSVLARQYDRAAWFWEHAVRVSGFTRAYGETLTAQGALSLPPGARVLDAGCGSGDLALAAARALNHHVTILGVDASAKMARRATRHLRSARVPGAAVQGDVLDLPFPDATFDAVMCAFVLEHLTEPQVALREFRRVLKPGAALFLIVAKPSFVVPAQRLLWPFEAWAETRCMPNSATAVGVARVWFPCSARRGALSLVRRQSGSTRTRRRVSNQVSGWRPLLPWFRPPGGA